MRRVFASPTATASTIPSTRSSRRRSSRRSSTPAGPRRSAPRSPPTTGSRSSSRRSGARRRSRPCTTPGSCASSPSAWEEYQRDVGPTHDVVPDVFAMPGLRDGHGRRPRRAGARSAARLGWWCFETTTPLTEGTYEAARSAVDVALSATDAGARRRAGRLRAVPAARPPRHDVAVRRLLLLQQRGDRRRTTSPPTTGGRVAVLDVDYHHGNGTQQIFYERDDVAFVSLHGDPARAYPYHTGFADETGAGRGSGLDVQRPAAGGHRRRRLPRRARPGARRGRRVRPGARRRVARRRHVRRRPDLRPRAHDRRLRPLRRGGRRARPPARRAAGGRLRRRRPRRQRHAPGCPAPHPPADDPSRPAIRAVRTICHRVASVSR